MSRVASRRLLGSSLGPAFHHPVESRIGSVGPIRDLSEQATRTIARRVDGPYISAWLRITQSCEIKECLAFFYEWLLLFVSLCSIVCENPLFMGILNKWQATVR